jgi:leader peptidase (prepilin peptidase)/N-methyltransferase
MRNLLPLLVLAGFGFRLSAIDLKVHRLPNRLVGFFTGTQLVTLLLLNLGNQKPVTHSLLVAGATTGTYLILFLLSRGSLGMGDVKFAFPLGLSIGWYCPDLWLVAIFISFCCGGIVAAMGLVMKQISPSSHIAFGPFMFFGSLVVCTFSILSR